MSGLKDFWTRWSFTIYTGAMVILYLLFQRRGRTIDQLTAQIQRAALAEKLNQVTQDAAKGDKDYADAKARYEDLKRNHGDLLRRYGMLPDGKGGTTH